MFEKGYIYYFILNDYIMTVLLKMNYLSPSLVSFKI